MSLESHSIFKLDFCLGNIKMKPHSSNGEPESCGDSAIKKPLKVLDFQFIEVSTVISSHMLIFLTTWLNFIKKLYCKKAMSPYVGNEALLAFSLIFRKLMKL